MPRGRRPLLQIPDDPKCAGQEKWFPLRGIVATHHHHHPRALEDFQRGGVPEGGAQRGEGGESQVSWAHETSRVRLYATAHGTTASVVPRGCHLEIFKCYPRLDVVWLLKSAMAVMAPALPPVCASLDSSATKICAMLASR